MTISMGIDNVLTQSDINNIAEFVHAVNVLQNDGLTVTQENLNEVMELLPCSTAQKIFAYCDEEWCNDWSIKDGKPIKQD